MLSGTPEKLQQPPAEAVKTPGDLGYAEAARGEIAETAKKAETPAEKVDRPLDVSEPVEQSFSARAKEIAGTLSAESKGFLGRIYERVKSSEIVQNITDRYQVWRNDGLAGRSQGKIAEFQREQVGEEAAAESALKRAQAVGADQEKLDKMFKDMGKEQSAEDKVKGEEEIAGLKAKAEEADMRAQLLSGEMSEEKQRIENYQARAQEARGHLDGRLAAKQEQNNKILEQHEARMKDIEAVAESQQTEVKEIEGHVKTLENFLTTAVSESARAGAQKTIDGFKTKQKVLEKAIQERIDAHVKLQEKTEKLREKNADWQAKRDAIFPPKEKAAPGEKPGEQPVNVEIGGDGKIKLSYGAGLRMALAGERLTKTEPDGKITTVPIREASQADKARLSSSISRFDMQECGVPPDLIEEIEKSAPGYTAEKPRFLARDIMAEWNKWYQKAYRQKGAVIRLEKGADPSADLKNQDAGKEFIFNLLAKKFGKTTKELNKGFAKQVDEFFKAREAAPAAA